MKKPLACHGCPAYEFSRDWVPDEIKPRAEVYLLNQNPGADEEAQGRPMVGKTGQTWESKYLTDAGLSRDQINIGNTIRCRWHGKNDLPPVSSVVVKQAMAHCQRVHFKIPEGTKLLVAAGDYACVALTGSTVADGDKAGSGWRGYVKPYDPIGSRVKSSPRGSSARTEGMTLLSASRAEGPDTTAKAEIIAGALVSDSGSSYWLPSPSQPLPVLVTWHIARTFHQPWWIIPTRRDWGKVPRLLRGTWPRKPPIFAQSPPQPWPQMFTFDTEYDRHTKALHRYSMAWGLSDGETCVVEAGDHWPPALNRQVRSRVVTQYSPADVQHLSNLVFGEEITGLEFVWRAFLIEDAVWKHAVLWSDHQHDLNYLGSIYSSFNRWKHLGASNPTLYAGLDATCLLEVDRALEKELDADPASRRVWETIDRPALGEFVRAQYRGIQTDPDRVAQAIRQLGDEVYEATLKARAVTGWPIKLSSNPMVGQRLYDIEGHKEPR